MGLCLIVRVPKGQPDESGVQFGRGGRSRRDTSLILVTECVKSCALLAFHFVTRCHGRLIALWAMLGALRMFVCLGFPCNTCFPLSPFFRAPPAPPPSRFRVGFPTFLCRYCRSRCLRRQKVPRPRRVGGGSLAQGRVQGVPGPFEARGVRALVLSDKWVSRGKLWYHTLGFALGACRVGFRLPGREGNGGKQIGRMKSSHCVCVCLPKLKWYRIGTCLSPIWCFLEFV